MDELKLCLYCEHMYWDTGEPWYSEVTPGGDLDFGCNENYWKLNSEKDDLETVRAHFERAKACPDFELRKREEKP